MKKLLIFMIFMVGLEKNKSYQLAATLDNTNIDPENPDLCKIEFSVTVNNFEDFVDNTVTVPGN